MKKKSYNLSRGFALELLVGIFWSVNATPLGLSKFAVRLKLGGGWGRGGLVGMVVVGLGLV